MRKKTEFQKVECFNQYLTKQKKSIIIKICITCSKHQPGKILVCLTKLVLFPNDTCIGKIRSKIDWLWVTLTMVLTWINMAKTGKR